MGILMDWKRLDVLRTTPVVVLVVVGMLAICPRDARAADTCSFDPDRARIVCDATGTAGDPPTGAPVELPEDPGLRYVYTATDAVIGECHYWSNVPGGLDAWDPANDPAVIATATRLPECPSTVVTDPVTRAWEILRSWDLAAPDPTLTPPDRGVTGLPTHIAAQHPATITHDEVLPDGRPLSVRAFVASIAVDWGDGTITVHDPSGATPYPTGAVAHTYRWKTCTAEYRNEHPSGQLCHPTEAEYRLDITFTWTGEYDLGTGWITLGNLTRSAIADYEVDEARGVTVP